MKEVTGDLWTYPADVRVITTNGTIKKNGECVMGRGCALEAKQRRPELPKRLGDMIVRRGNEVHYLLETLYSFPVKHNWYEKADIALIVSSAKQLRRYIDEDWGASAVVVMPRPGCGNGKLQWVDVRKVLEPILDDRFHVITKG